MERTAVLRTLADALSSSPPGDLDDHVVDDLCALFGTDAPLVVEAIFGNEEIHRDFVAAFPHLRASHPLMEFDPSNWREPMRLA